VKALAVIGGIVIVLVVVLGVVRAKEIRLSAGHAEPSELP
jgi:hypothetical protein